MRVSSLLNQMLALQGAWVTGVEFGDRELIVDVRRRGVLHQCPCGRKISASYDHSVRRWRHLDFGAMKLWIRCEIARVWCAHCQRVRTENVPWARPAARLTRDFENVVAWLAQRMDKTSISVLMRCSWEAVHNVVERYVAEHLDPSRLDNLFRIGVDEVSYRKGRKFLTVVSDHDTRRVVWVGEGARRETIDRFYAELGPLRCDQLTAVTMDCSPSFIGGTREYAPNATICYDAFHVVRWATEALDSTFRATQITSVKMRMVQERSNLAWYKARYALRAAREKLKPDQQKWLRLLRSERKDIHRAYLIKEELRDLFQIIAPENALDYLTQWIKTARKSGITAFSNLANRIERHADGIVAAVEHGLSNARAEGINTKIRVIQRRGYGHVNPKTLASMIYLSCSGMQVKLPTQT